MIVDSCKKKKLRKYNKNLLKSLEESVIWAELNIFMMFFDAHIIFHYKIKRLSSEFFNNKKKLYERQHTQQQWSITLEQNEMGNVNPLEPSDPF